MTDDERDVDVGAGWYTPVEYDEFEIIRSMAREVAESWIKKAKLERELNMTPKKCPPFWKKWKCRFMEKK